MTIFDLVFIASFFTSIVLLIRIFWKLFRRNLQEARRAVIKLVIFWVLYTGALIAVSLSTPQRVLAMREDLCFDDWCLAVDDCSSAHNSSLDRYVVGLRVSSRAGRVSQRAPDASVYLTDERGTKFYPSPDGQRAYEALHGESKALSDLLKPYESFSTVRVFDLPPESKDVGLVVVHGQGPGWFIIGDSQSLFHKRTITRLKCTKESGLSR
jgi:hypothetical protein